jgi:hypothetical protein
MSGGAAIPEEWERVWADGPGPFVTTELLRRPDGKLVRRHSRGRRKGAGGRLGPGERHPGGE